MTRARASATRCCCPPESADGFAAARSARPTRASHSAACARASGTRDASTPETERHVLEHGQVGKEEVVLEDDPHAARLGRDEDAGRRIVDRRTIDDDPTGVDRDESGERAQQRRLARAVRAEHRDGLPVGRLQRDLEVELAQADPELSGQRHAAPRTSGPATTPTRSSRWRGARGSARSRPPAGFRAGCRPRAAASGYAPGCSPRT